MAETFFILSFQDLDRYLERLCQPENSAHRVRRKTDLIETVVDTLAAMPRLRVFRKGASASRYYDQVKSKKCVNLTRDEIYDLIAALHDGKLPSDAQGVTGALGPPPEEPSRVPTGDAQRGEIEIVRVAPEGNLVGHRHAPADKYVAVYVDDVQFRQLHRKTGKVEVLEGRYIRIEVPGGTPGAVVLPVDLETGEVLLVTQYRHPQRSWLTEVPRGFGRLNRDLTPLQTALREVKEETAGRPVRINGRDFVVPLRNLNTDTGKLADAPGYFLFFLDKERQIREFRSYPPLMESPVWIPLNRFLEAVFREAGTALSSSEYTFALGDEERKSLFAATEFESGRLHIRDAFSTNVALLALPHLVRHFAGNPRVPAEWFDLANYA